MDKPGNQQSSRCRPYDHTNTTQNGGILALNPPGYIYVSDPINNPLLTLNNGATTADIQSVTIGNLSGAKGQLLVEDASVFFNSGNAYLGTNTNSFGKATITGTDSQWNNNGDLYVGGFGTGTLNVESSGTVSSSSGYVGYGAGSNGTATITGTGSKWKNDGQLYVGYGGKGMLNIENGGTVSSTEASLGSNFNTASEGTATVTGTGSNWNIENFLSIGVVGSGTLNVEDGGTVSSGYATVGVLPGSKSAVTITGAGSQWNITYGLNLGFSGSATLDIENGGLITSHSGRISYDSTATITGPHSQWDTGVFVDFYVGYVSGGTLNIENSGLVNSTDAYVGYSSGTGNVTISGAGSQWQLSGDLYIASGSSSSERPAHGTIDIKDGGNLTSENGYVGLRNGFGTINVTDKSSLWQIDGDLNVGQKGTGELNIANGGLVTSNSGKVGSDDGTGTATIAGADSRWQINSSLNVGVDGVGKLLAQDGGVVEVGGLLTVGATGTLGGDGGTILADVVNQGTIAPGNSPGVLTIDGNLTSTGIVQFELAGIGTGLFDQLIVTGELNLGGVVEIDLINGFNPIFGSSFKLLNFGSLIESGFTFDLSHATLATNLSWDTSTFATDGTLRVVPEASSLMLAGMATFASLFVWRKNAR